MRIGFYLSATWAAQPRMRVQLARGTPQVGTFGIVVSTEAHEVMNAVSAHVAAQLAMPVAYRHDARKFD